MLQSSSLVRKRITNGIYEGVYSDPKGTVAAPLLELNFLGEALGEVFADPIEGEENTWLIRCKIPTETLSDGIQTFLICKMGEDTVLDSFSIVMGEPLSDDLRAEISLLREELDMLKRAFRRHCVETMG
jgi:hypothetical protein